MERTEQIRIESIMRDGGTQQRELQPSVVAHYRELMDEGVEFPPIETVFDGAYDYLVDGFHRVEAASQLGRETILARRRMGTRKDAVWASFAANKANGLPRKRGEVAAIVRKILTDPEWQGKTQQQVAEHVGCTQSWVSDVQSAIDAENKRTRPASTDNIGTDIIGESEQELSTEDAIIGVIRSAKADFREVKNQILATRSEIMKRLDEGDPTWQAVNRSRIKGLFSELTSHLKLAQPHALCPYCRGVKSEACRGCRGNGWVHRMAWDAAPEELKIGLEPIK